MKNLVKLLLSSLDLRLSRLSKSDVVDKGNPRCAEAVASVYELMSDHVLPHLPPLTDNRVARITSLPGVTITQAIYLIDLLRETSNLEGAVLEMGVAQGFTSQLIAVEILEQTRDMWLFDSFKGLPAPTAEDELIDDIFSLGDIAAYAGKMSVPRRFVEQKLHDCGFPESRIHIVEGFFDAGTPQRVSLPQSVSFAFVDFDFYQPVCDALGYLDGVLEPGACVAVHDYDFFSTGPKKAVEEFLAANEREYTLSLPVYAHGMAILRKERGDHPSA